MKKERIQKLISSSGLCSRRQAEILILTSRVTLNGKTAEIGDCVDGLTIKSTPPGKVILINKPVGFICSCSDPYGRKTVLDMLPKNIRKGLYPIGRLDKESRGAILLTNLGELAFKLTHPSYAHTKTYEVLVHGKPDKYLLEKSFSTESVKFLILNSIPSLIKIVIALIQEDIVSAVSNIGSLSS